MNDAFQGEDGAADDCIMRVLEKNIHSKTWPKNRCWWMGGGEMLEIYNRTQTFPNSKLYLPPA